MIIRKYAKSAWKALMKQAVRLYTLNPDLYVYNNPTALDPESYGQFGQDTYVLRLLDNKTGGYFIDVGANDPVAGSNTYLLEKRGWKGLAFEPQEHLRSRWPLHRSTPCLGYAVGPENGNVEFITAAPEQHGLSGVEGYNKSTRPGIKSTVVQRRLSDILREYGVEHVDYLSIDVEGYEMMVLEGIDFPREDIKVIGIENDTAFGWLPIVGKRLGSELGSNRPRKFLKQKGYRHIARIVCDDFFIKEKDGHEYQKAP